MGFDPIFILYYIKMTKTTTINGTDYEVKKFTIPCGLCSFWSLYDRPSQTKIEIYEEWEKVLNNIYGCVGSKFAFTIYWNVKDETTGQLYDVRISKSHNYLM